MPTITFILKDGTPKTVDAASGYSLMEIGQQHRIDPIEGLCGGCMSCGTCHMYIHPDWVGKTMPDDGIGPDEEDMLDLSPDPRPSSRLGCQIIMRDDLDGLVVAVPGSGIDW